MTERKQIRYFERLRVRWAEVDMQGIVFNGHYLMYFDTAISGYWRALALPFQQTMRALGGDMYVRKATLDYLASARLNENLDLGVRSVHIGNSSLRIECTAFRGDQLLVSGELVYVYADPATQTSRPIPQGLREAIARFEAGQAMVEVELGAWDSLGADAGPIRAKVFVEEQQIPADLEWDSADAVAVHALARNHFGLPLGTGRLLEHVPGVAKIGRMAVLPAVRGGHIGRAVLDALMQAARVRGDHQVLLHAQLSAVPFYVRAGFVTRGESFDEAGIAHVEMVRAL